MGVIMAGRLFTFGCSFTKYHWPTWADLLLSQTEGENWGSSGGGNKFIFESLIECDVKNKLTEDDSVIIMWTSFFREDRYIKNHWINVGNVYNAEPLYDKKFLQTYWDDFGAAFNNLNFICAAIRILNGVGCKWKMASMLPLLKFNEYNDNISELDPRLANHFEVINSSNDNWINHDLQTFNRENLHGVKPIKWAGYANYEGIREIPNFIDSHPTTLMHWMWAKTYLQEFIKSPFIIDRIAFDSENKLLAISQTDKYITPSVSSNFSICKSVTRI